MEATADAETNRRIALTNLAQNLRDADPRILPVVPVLSPAAGQRARQVWPVEDGPPLLSTLERAVDHSVLEPNAASFVWGILTFGNIHERFQEISACLPVITRRDGQRTASPEFRPNVRLPD